jgi:hypothetical protein
VIGVSGVTVNLNGFSIVGTGADCGVGAAITAPNAGQQIVVRNGIIVGVCQGITLNSTVAAIIEQVNILTTGGQIIAAGAGSVLRGNYFSGGNSGIACPSIVTDSVFVSAGNNTPTATCVKANVLGSF